MSLDPRTRLLLVAWVGGLGILLDRPAPLLVLCCLVSLVAMIALSGRGRRAFLGVALALLWSAALSQGLFYGDHPRHALLRVGSVPLWREGVAFGLVTGARFVASAAAAAALIATTPTDGLLRGLLGLRVPAGPAVLAVAGLRSVPELIEETATAWRSRRQRRAGEARLTSAKGLLVPVLARTLRRALTLAEVLDLRGFDVVDGRLDPPPRLPLPDRAVLAAAFAVLAVLFVTEGLVLARAWGLFFVPWLEPVLRRAADLW